MEMKHALRGFRGVESVDQLSGFVPRECKVAT
jgi:hypothetical protein